MFYVGLPIPPREGVFLGLARGRYFRPYLLASRSDAASGYQYCGNLLLLAWSVVVRWKCHCRLTMWRCVTADVATTAVHSSLTWPVCWRVATTNTTSLDSTSDRASSWRWRTSSTRYFCSLPSPPIDSMWVSGRTSLKWPILCLVGLKTLA